MRKQNIKKNARVCTANFREPCGFRSRGLLRDAIGPKSNRAQL